MGYGLAKQYYREPAKYGQGTIEGIIAHNRPPTGSRRRVGTTLGHLRHSRLTEGGGAYVGTVYVRSLPRTTAVP